MSAENKGIALARLADYVAGFPPEFVIAQDDLVTVAVVEHRVFGEQEYEFTTFHTYRIAGGVVIEEWSNAAPGTAPAGSGRPQPADHVPRPIGDGDPEAGTRRVADFFRFVLESHDPDAAKDYVTEDYLQHAGHIAPGRAGLEAFIRQVFPDGPIATPEQLPFPPAILMGEGDRVVIAGAIPQPDGHGGTYVRYAYDGFRLEGDLIAEHWSGIDPGNRPAM